MPKAVTESATAAGRKMRHVNVISWSKRYLGKAARIQMKANISESAFSPSHRDGCSSERMGRLLKGNHPPRNRVLVRKAMNIMLAYSQ